MRDELIRITWFLRAVIDDWRIKGWHTWGHVVFLWRYAHSPLMGMTYENIEHWYEYDEGSSDPYEEFA
jgi:hypothetical protein